MGEAQQHWFSLSSPGSKETEPCAVHWYWGGEVASGTLCLLRHCSSPGTSEPSESLAWLGRCWLQKAPPGGFFSSGQRQKRFRGWMGPEMQFVMICDCANHRELESSLAVLRGSRDGGTAGSWELGVRSLPRGSLSQRRPCQSLWCRAR